MQAYTGKYFNGLTNTSVNADITLTARQLVITITDAQGTPRQVIWFWDQVQLLPGDAYTLQYPGYPLQTITVTDSAFHSAAAYYLRHHKGRRFFANRGRIIIAMVFLAVVGIAAALYFWLVPFLAVRIANRVPPAYEVQLGQQSYNALIKHYRVKPAATRLVNDFFRQLKIPSQYPVQITVVQDRQANAFALPGGHIIVYDHLLQQMQHYEELAALLSHEYAHVQLKHTTKTLFRSIGTYAFLSLLFGDLTGIGAVVVENANSLKSLQYSRGLEKEADLYGLRLLEERHIDPRGFTWLFHTLEQQGGAQPAEWLSSHPGLQSRLQYIEQQAGRNTPAVTDTTLARLWEDIKRAR